MSYVLVPIYQNNNILTALFKVQRTRNHYHHFLMLILYAIVVIM